MNVKIDDATTDVLIAKHAKLNELKDQQMDAVRELVKDSVDAGMQIGEVNGAVQTVEIYNAITQKLILARTFTASATAIVLTYPFVLLLKDMWLVIIATAAANTLAFYLVDLLAMGIRKLKSWIKKKKINELKGSSTDDKTGQT